jgi:hypothetical protein
MKLTHCLNGRPQRQQGKILIFCVFTMAAIGMVLVSYLKLSSTHQLLVARSQNWNAALPVAEAGIEEAMTQINWNRGLNLASLGWTVAGSGYTKTRHLDSNGFYTVSIQPSGTHFLITSTGRQRTPPGTNYVARTIEAEATRTNMIFTKALIAKKHIRAGHGTLIDSFDSTDSKYSSGGVYTASKRKDNASIAATSSKHNAVRVDKTKIYGMGSTSPQGTFEFKNGAALGDTKWVDGSNAGGQSGKIDDDFTYDFPLVKAPWTSGGLPPAGGDYKGTDYQYILTSGNWQLGKVDLSKPVIVTSNSTAVLYVTGDFKADQDIIIEKGAKLILYMAGHKFEVAGKKIEVDVNKGNATQFQYYGLESNKEVRIKKNGNLTGVIYAPHAKVKIEGTDDVVGCVVGKCVHFKHDGQMHFDEAINKLGTVMDLYALSSWKE